MRSINPISPQIPLIQGKKDLIAPEWFLFLNQFLPILNSDGYTVATLPQAGQYGRKTFVTDALSPSFLTAVTGGGAVVCPVFDNGITWVVA